jgi:hypothetical protein
MDKIIESAAEKRLELFKNTTTATGIPMVMVEKDFWICYVLTKIFGDTELSEFVLSIHYVS